jgi:hypothetical protein
MNILSIMCMMRFIYLKLEDMPVQLHHEDIDHLLFIDK